MNNPEELRKKILTRLGEVRDPGTSVDVISMRLIRNVEVTEGDMWEEVRALGLQCEACEVLKEKYPKVFQTAEKREGKNRELQAFIKTEFGFDFTQMTVASYLKLTEAVIDYKLKK